MCTCSQGREARSYAEAQKDRADAAEEALSAAEVGSNSDVRSVALTDSTVVRAAGQSASRRGCGQYLSARETGGRISSSIYGG